MDSKLREQLIHDEGLKLKAYRDNSKGKLWTIGVGHLLGEMPRMTEITLDEAFALLEGDVQAAGQAATNVFGIDAARFLDSARWRAMVNMAFNRGEGHMRDSTTITPAIKKALANPTAVTWTEVAMAIKASPWAAQIGLRALRLADMFETGKDPR